MDAGDVCIFEVAHVVVADEIEAWPLLALQEDVRALLPAVLDAAERFAGPPADDEIERLVERARMTPLFVS